MRESVGLPVVFVVLISSVVAFAQPAPEQIPVSGLKAPVTVRRDARSIPYIDASNEQDLFYAQGYVTAKDRLWQMELLRRVASGELAELFGKAALEQDKRWRNFGFARRAEEGFQTLSPGLRAALESYSRGVNDYLATLTDETLPPEFKILRMKPRPWNPSDAVLIGRILADALSTTWQFDVAREAIENLPPDMRDDLLRNVTPYDVVLFDKDDVKNTAPGVTFLSSAEVRDLGETAKADQRVREESLRLVGLFAEDLAASNNWVISGKRTADGMPMLSNDPHLAPQAPGIWYLTHLSTPNMRVAGVTFPGVPGVVLGHNAHIAWGATNVGPDVQDLYKEEFNEKGEYKVDGRWVAPTVRKEFIKVRTNPLSPETETVEQEVIETRNGVLIATPNGGRYALKWTALDPKNQEFEAFFGLNHARDWAGFRQALKAYGGATQNFIYADVSGNIGWQTAGRIPIRKTGHGARVHDGTTGEGDWTGYIPFDEMPRLYNPPGGTILTANQRIVGTAYKYPQMSRDAAMPWRARRIYDLLKADRKFTMDDFRDILHDSYNFPVHLLAKEIVKRGSASKETLDVLNGWDGKMLAAAKAPLLANEIRNVISEKIAAEHKEILPQILREKLMWWVVQDNAVRWLPKGFESYDALLKAADAEARANLEKRYGSNPDDWTWGKAWVSRFTHPLAAAPLIGAGFATPVVAIDGSGQSPNVGSNISMQLIASPGNWDATRHVIPLGQSGDPRSPHWKDQFEAWRTGAPAVFPFTKAAVEKAAGVSTVMTPR